jgi:hypothetical protein
MLSYDPYIPQNLDELWDLVGSMVLGAPKFIDTSGFFPGKGIETEYFRLTEGLKLARPELGEERYVKLVEMGQRTRAYFVAAADDDADEVWAGRNLLLDMEEIMDEARASQRPG